MFWKLLFVFASIVIHVSSKYASQCNTTDQQPGLCMPVKSCKTVYNFFNRISKSGQALTDQDKNNIASMFCGTFQNVPHICCPKTEIQLNAEGLDILQRQKCGIYFVDRIARGSIAPLFQYPWMALLKYEDEFKPFKCGGTLISDQYVLTAAHCVKGHEHSIKAVRLGEHQISTEFDCTNSTRKNQCAPPVEDIDVEEIIIHEDYKNVYNDIALIKLNRKVEFNRHIKPVCLPISDDLRSKVHENYIISGWGRTEDGSSSDILMTAFVPIVNRTDCENQLRKYNLLYSLNVGHICAGGRNLVDSCSGDSGGPLGYRDFYNGSARFVQFGIVSMGLRRCGIVNAPGIYTNVSYHMQWITDNLKETTHEKHIISPRFAEEEPCTTPALESGYCVPYKDCQFVSDLSANYGSYDSIPKYYLNYIFKSKCSRGNEPIRLCCKLEDNPVTSTVPTTPKAAEIDPRFTEDLDFTKDFSSQLNSEGLRVLNQIICGVPDGDRVAGGNETELAEFPWMALLRYDSPGAEFKCGGALITNRFVLTATHCVNNNVYPVIGVRLGEHNLSTNPDCKKKFKKNVCMPVVEDFGVEQIITHPRYSQKSRVNDIALIKLDREVEFKRHIKPVCLPITQLAQQITTNAFTIAGWGATENSTRSTVLLKAQVSGEARAVCQSRYAPLGIEINQKHICAADLLTGRDTCKGDSGGPLFAFNSYIKTKRFIQYGIVAAGGAACNLEQKFPGLYTNIITFLPWITNNIV